MSIELTHEYLTTTLDYNPETGVFIWKNSKQPGRNGSVAGKLGDGTYNNYAVIGLNGHQYSMSRVAWFYVYGKWPKHQVRFLNGDPSDVRIANLTEKKPKSAYHYMKQVDPTLPVYKQKREPIGVRRQKLKSSYGITLEQYAEMLVAQNGVCAICAKPETVIHRNILNPLGVDHDHETGKIRGLLCRKCNSGLGNFNDDPNLMVKAISYLRPHSEHSNVVPLKKAAIGDNL